MGLKVAELFGDLKLRAGNALGNLKTFNERLSKGQGELTKTEKKTAELGTAWERAGNKVRMAGQKIVEAAKESAKSSDGAAANAKRMAGSFANAGKAVLAFSVGAQAAFTAFAFSWSAAVDKIAKDAKKLGVSAKELQELQFAAQISGASADDLNAGVRELSKGMFELRTKGTGPLKDGFEAVGLSIDDFEGKKLTETFGIIADAVNNVEDPLQRTAIRMKIFGSAGIQLSELLNLSSDSIRTLSEEASTLGGVVGVDGFRAAEDFADAWLRLKTIVGGLASDFATRSIPVLIEFIDNLRKWIAKNREVIATKLDEWVTRFIGFIEKSAPVFFDFLQGLGDIIEKMGGVTGSIEKFLIVWGTFKVSVAALALTGNPVIAGVLALAGAFALVASHIKDANEARKALAREAESKIELRGISQIDLDRSSDPAKRALSRKIDEVRFEQGLLRQANIDLSAAEDEKSAGESRTTPTEGRSFTELASRRENRSAKAGRAREIRDELAKRVNALRLAAQEEIDAIRKVTDAANKAAIDETTEAINQGERFNRNIERRARIANKELELAQSLLDKTAKAAKKVKEVVAPEKRELSIAELIAGATGQGLAGAVGTFRPSGPGTTINQFTVNNTVGPTTVTIEVEGLENARPSEVASAIQDRLAEVIDGRVRAAFEAGNRNVLG